MGIVAWIFGALGGLSAVAGIVNAFGFMPPLGADFTTMFWLALSAVLLLAAIAFAVGRAGSYE